MELYFKNAQGQLEETTLYNVLTKAFHNAGFKMDNGSFIGEDHKWIGIVQESNKPSEVVTNISLNNDGNTIIGLKVYETPIKRVLDEDNSKEIV